MESIRGEIYNRPRAKQINNFNGLIYGAITPTDIDGVIDFHGKCFVFLEMKYRDTPLPFGQRLAFERIVNNSKRPAICIIARHDMQPDLDVDVKNCMVSEYYTGNTWRHPRNPYNVKRMIDEFLSRYAPECLHL